MTNGSRSTLRLTGSIANTVLRVDDEHSKLRSDDGFDRTA